MHAQVKNMEVRRTKEAGAGGKVTLLGVRTEPPLPPFLSISDELRVCSHGADPGANGAEIPAGGSYAMQVGCTTSGSCSDLFRVA